MYPVINVDGEFFEIYEQLGTKGKFWYDEGRYLFKAGRPGTGENWAEVVASRIAQGLGLPCASYELAETDVSLDGVDRVNGLTRGVVTPNFTTEGQRLILGNELIVSVSKNEIGLRKDRRSRHTVPRLVAFLGGDKIGVPSNWNCPREINSAVGVMAGYLLLDVLIGNQDRHEENWGIVVTPSSDGERRFYEIAPTFDHASSMGRNESDERRVMKLAHKSPVHGIQGYAGKALSQIYDTEGRRLTTLQAFLDFSSHCKSQSEYWIGRLTGMNEVTFRLFVQSIPHGWISDAARDFSTELLLENRRRLLQVRL